jgi:O-antigen/teichoic acid export membrane protein
MKQGLHHHIYDIGITFFATLVSTFLSFVLTIILARYFGATDLGIYRLALTTYGIIMLFVASAIPAAMIKYVAEYRYDLIKLNKLLSTGIILASIFGGICMISLFFLSDFIAEILHAPELSGLLKILVIIIPFSLLTGVLNGYLNGMRLMRLLAISTIFQSITLVSISILFLQMNFGLEGIIISTVIASICNFLLLLYYVHIDFTFEWNTFLDTSKLLLLFGLPVIAASFVGQINTLLDNFFIGLYLTPADVGIYSIAWLMSSLIWLLPSAIQRITYPLTSEMWGMKKISELHHMLNLSLRFSTAIICFGSLLLVFFGKQIILILFTTEFSQAYIPLVILLIGSTIRGIMTSIGSTVAGIGKPGVDLIPTILMCVIWITLDILLIPYFGIIGVAISATISLTFGSLIGLYYIKKCISICFNWKWYFKTTILIISCISTYWILSFILVSEINGILILSIFSVIFYYKIFSNDDRLFLKRVIKNSLNT